MNAKNGGNWIGGNREAIKGGTGKSGQTFSGGQTPEALDGDVARIVALMNSMPRVAAPKDFDARLMARIAEAKAEEREFGGLKNLLADLPVAAAPADFDFKLRARLAQARSEEQLGFWSRISASLSESFGGLRFSMVQASAALLLVGAIVSGVTYKYLATPGASRSENYQIAKVSTPAEVGAISNNNNNVSPGNAEVVDVPGRQVPHSRTPMAMSVSTRAARPVAVTPREVVTPAVEPAGSEVGAVMIKHSGNGSTRMVGVVSYGMQNAVARQNVARPSREDLSTQVF